MALKIFETARSYPWVKSLKVTDDDAHSDRLNHRYTAGFLLTCMIVAAGSPFVFSRISCWVPAQFHGSYSKYTENYCWISNTYYVPTNETLPASAAERTRREISYYQWAPFILLLCAFFFYLPRMLWRSMNTRSGIDLQHLIGKGTPESIAGSIKYYCESHDDSTSVISRCFRTLFCTSGKRLGNYLRSIYIMTKGLYFFNSLIQLLVVQWILGQPGWLYGVDVWYKIFIENSVLTDSPYFPRVTLCDLLVREVGNTHRYTVQCVLPINMLNEKIFALAWFWLLYVFVSNLFSFAFALIDTVVPARRLNFIRDLARASQKDSDLDERLLSKFVHDFLRQDGILVLYLIHQNARAFLTLDVVKLLFKEFAERERQLESQEASTRFVSSPV